MTTEIEDILYHSELATPTRSDWDKDRIIKWAVDSTIDSDVESLIESALADIQSFTALTFVQEGFGNGVYSDIVIGLKSTEKFGETLPITEIEYLLGRSAVVLLSDTLFSLAANTYDGSILNYTVMHEIFHALGAGHVDDFGQGFQTAALSLTSYYFEDVHVAWSPSLPLNYSSLDILTLQSWYGVNSNIDIGSNVYSFSDASMFRTVYDTGGIDLVDVSQLTTAAFIDLRPGYYSKAGDRPLFGTAFSGDVVQAAMVRQGTPGDASSLDTRIENAIGTSLEDTIIGNSAANFLYGLTSNDVIYGGVGNDTLVGGDGDDTLVGSYQGVPDGAIPSNLALEWGLYHTDDAIEEIDTADYSPTSRGNEDMVNGINVDMTLGSKQVKNDGYGHEDTLVSIEKIIGSKYADYFNIAGSLKIVDGGDENDRVSFSSSNVAVQIDLNQTTQHGGIAEGIQLTSIEEVVTGGGNDTIYLRNAEVTKAWGGGGIDVIYGGNGENTVWGQAGNDTYYHRGGRSTFYGEGDIDTLNMALASGDEFFFDWANGTVDRHRAVTGDAEIKFSLVENFFGSEADDTFLFGNEAMAYSGTKVTFDGKGGSNTLDFSRVTGTVGIKLNKDASSDPTAIAVDNRSSIKFLNIENIIGTGTDDFLILLNGMKTIKGGDGFDVLDISRWTEGDAIFYMETGKSVLSGSGLTLENIESFITRAGQMGIVGTSGVENFTGTSGVDRFWGRGGNDIFNRSLGVDRFWGEDGNDTFYSKAGDIVDGGNDYDILHLRQEGNGYGTSHMANFKNIEEVHIEGATLVNAIFDGSIEKLYSSPWGSSYIKFTDGSKDREVYTGDKNDNIQFWGGGFVDGGGGDNWLDLRKMNGLVWDQTASEFHWGDRTIKYANIQHFQFNSDTVIANSISGSDAFVFEDYSSDEGFAVASLANAAIASSYDPFWG